MTMANQRPRWATRARLVHAAIAGGGAAPLEQLQVDVAVVGAGLAGLSAAIFLQKRGINVTLFDRHETLEGQGVETTVGVLFQECYRAAGVDLTADLERIGTPIAFYIVRDGDGNVVSRERVDATSVAFGRQSYDVSRPELMRLLLAKFVDIGGVFRGGAALQSVEIIQGSNGAPDLAQIQFEGGLTVQTPSLIAADGIHSRVRKLLFDEVPPSYPGISLVYGILPGCAGLVADEPESFQMLLADEFSVLTSHYQGADPSTWFAVLSRSEAPLLGRSIWAEEGKSETEAGAIALVDSVPALRAAFLEQPSTPPRFVYSGGLQTRELRPDFRWHKGPVLLIGDAVHGLTPWGGYSGQMAVEDGYVVAQYQARATHFADIEATRRPRVLEFQNKSVDQKADGLGEGEAVAKAHLDRVRELTSCPAFQLHVFVVGIGGRIGSAVAKTLLARGAAVLGVARTPNSRTEQLARDGATIHIADVSEDSWEKHLPPRCDAVVCALRGLPNAVLPLQLRVLEAARRASVPRFVAADFLPDYTCDTSRSAQLHPMLAERIQFRKHLSKLTDITGLHVHIGCLLELDELFGEFMGVWNADQRELSFWGSEDTAFDVTTVEDAAAATVDALYSGKIGDMRVASATVSVRELAEALESHQLNPRQISLRCQGSLSQLDKAILALPSDSVDAIRLHCQRSLFAGDTPLVGSGVAKLRDWVARQTTLQGDEPVPWITPDLSQEGLVQVDVKTQDVDGDLTLRSEKLSSLKFEQAWLELARRALTSGAWAETRFATQVLEAVMPGICSTGKLWLGGVACFFTGHFAEGVDRFDLEFESNPVDAEEILWRELNSLAAGLSVYPPSPGCLVGFLNAPDPRPVMNRILQYYAGHLTREDLLRSAFSRSGSASDRFYASMYVALHLLATGIGGDAEGKWGHESQQLLAVAQRQNCRDNLGLCCANMQVLPFVRIRCGANVEESYYSCPRLLLGCAGLAADDPSSVVRLRAAIRRGACAVDVADIYPGAEQLVKVAGARIVHTKYVPDASKLAELDEHAVKAAVLRSLARISRTPQAIQLHWWGESSDPQLRRVAAALEGLRVKDKYFRCLGVTNMGVDHLRAVCASATVGVAQVALSLLDRRALEDQGVKHFCESNGICLVAYGVLCGGLLSERWVGVAEPREDEVAPSQRKYLARIRAQGGWAEFQALLRGVGTVAHRHGGVSFSTVAIAWSLHHASAVIVGCPRSTGSGTQEQRPDQLDCALAALDLVLDDVELALLDRPPSQQLTQGNCASQPGVYTDERDISHPIGATMAPWRDTAHLGPSAADEATERARGDPDSPFVRDELAALGLLAIPESETSSNHLARVESHGVGGSWVQLAVELQHTRSCEGGASQLAHLGMDAVDRLSIEL